MIELNRLGVSASRLKLVFNMVDAGVTVAQVFDLIVFSPQKHDFTLIVVVNDVAGSVDPFRVIVLKRILRKDPTGFLRVFPISESQ